MKRLHLLISSLVIFSLFTFHFSLPALGQEATDSAVSDEEVKQNIRERLEKVAKDDSTLGTTTNLKRAWVGTLSDISNSTLSISTSEDTKQAAVATDAAILNQNRQPISLKNLEIGSFVIAMGYLEQNQVLQTKRVVISSPPEQSPYQSYLVQIVSISKDSITVTSVSDPQNSWALSTDSNTSITQTVDSTQTDIELSDLKVEDRLVIIASPDPKEPGTLDAVAIHLVTSRTIPASTPEATSSAKPE